MIYHVRELKEGIFNTIGKIIIGGGLSTDALGLENEDFSDDDQCQCMCT